MRGNTNGRIESLAAMALIAGLGSMNMPAGNGDARTAQAQTNEAKSQPAERTKAPRGMPSLASIFGNLPKGSRGHQRRAGPGWSNRHVKRMAVKARNVKAHRARSRA